MKLPRYPKYKDSGVKWLGQVPEHWEISVLKRMAHIELSNVDKKTEDGEAPVRLCNYLDVYRNEKITAGLDFMAASASDEQISRLSLQQGDVIITKDSESPDDIGVPAFVSDTFSDVVCGYHLALIRPYSRKADGLYIARVLKSKSLQAHFSTSAIGMTRFGLGKYEIENAFLPKPPYDEQRQIAAFLDYQLDKIDRLILAQQRLIELLKEKRQAIISHTVTHGPDPDVPMKPSGIDWIDALPSHWRILKLKFLIRKIEQGWSPQCENVPAEEGEWSVLKVGCVNGGRFNPQENKKLPQTLDPEPKLGVCKDDLLISRANTRELVGSAAVALKDYPKHMLCDKLYRLTVDRDKCNPHFVALFLSTPSARSEIELAATGASQSMVNIAQSVIANMVFPVPPLDEQQKIVEHISDEGRKLEGLIDKALHAVALLQERRSALISAAITGQIDVRNYRSGEAPALCQ